MHACMRARTHPHGSSPAPALLLRSSQHAPATTGLTALRRRPSSLNSRKPENSAVQLRSLHVCVWGGGMRK
jgi:hypothetical protein